MSEFTEDQKAAVRHAIARARAIAEDTDSCDEAEAIIEQVEVELGLANEGATLARAYEQKFASYTLNNLDADQTRYELRKAFRTGYDAGRPTEVESDPAAATRIERERQRRLLGEGIHTAFRKAGRTETATTIWKLINDMDAGEWDQIVAFVADGLSPR